MKCLDFFLFFEYTEPKDEHGSFKTSKVKERHLPWITSNLVSISRQRDNAWPVFSKSKDPADCRSAYSTVRGNKQKLSPEMPNPVTAKTLLLMVFLYEKNPN